MLVMKELNWNRIAIVFENDTYGRDCAMSLNAHAQQSFICVSNLLAISVSESGDVSLDQINAVLDKIMLQSPVTEGVFLFASKQVTNKVLIAVDNKGIAKVPLFILSEAVGLKGNVFLSSGSILQKTKGSLTLSMPYTEITSFTDYWLSLVTNMTMLTKKALFNPWLNDMFESVTGCNPSIMHSCQALTVEQAKDIFPLQPVYLQYSIIAAHTMAKALLQVYSDICISSSADCVSNFRDQFEPYMMVEKMKDISIDFGTNFNHAVSVEPLTSSQYKITFRNLSEPVTTSDHEVYQVYNYRKQSSNVRTEEFNLVKVS